MAMEIPGEQTVIQSRQRDGPRASLIFQVSGSDPAILCARMMG
jgi:hypothetical protein